MEENSNSYYKSSQMPKQRVSDNEKQQKRWYIPMADYIDRQCQSYSDKDNIITLYNIANGVIKENDYTHITVILDRSGSMESIRNDTIGGFNAFLDQQKAGPGLATFSLVQFDSRNLSTASKNDVKMLKNRQEQWGESDGAPSRSLTGS